MSSPALSTIPVGRWIDPQLHTHCVVANATWTQASSDGPRLPNTKWCKPFATSD